ncbi:hypothetical protein H2201_008707 [Coniosporium apollinis]|uniref:Major facilitator superfamily (MFS) profile domain-containing protein n=1 Tax=Coniosporium apollinis TaxID=61459 RepID=A0ABQ9NM43_9PEZI|nr:hypothetical protein H2201_008707 [Coniosporium apollinis]
MAAQPPPATTGSLKLDGLKQAAEAQDLKKLSGISLYSRFAFAGAVCCSKILQMDFVGTFTLMGAVVCFHLAMQWGGVTKSWSSADVIGTLIGFVLISVVFVALEIYLGERALIIPRLMKDNTLGFNFAFQVFNNGAFFVLLYYLPIYFQVVSGVSTAQSGVRNIPYIVGIFFSIASGVAITITGEY